MINISDILKTDIIIKIIPISIILIIVLFVIFKKSLRMSSVVKIIFLTIVL